MMKVIRAAAELNPGPRKTCVAIGVFDGVHLGHQQVIRRTISDAQEHGGLSVVVTFDQHPTHVTAPQHAPLLIYPLEKKLEVIASLGVDATWLIHFDKAFSEIPAEQFVRSLASDFKPLHSISVGSDFSFGRRRTGNVSFLRKFGQELNFTVHGLASVSLDEQPISSTRVREAIRLGNLESASQMLGRPYALTGRIIKGDQLGRTFGFPTANLDVSELILPPNGVYASHALMQEKTFRAVVNLGFRPTLQSPVPRLQVEAHLLDFNQEVYGEEIELVFLEKLRDEQRFPSVEALKKQIEADIAHARSRFTE